MSKTVAKLLASMEVDGVPQHLREGLAYYVAEGRKTGSFLDAVLINSLVGAVYRADPESEAALGRIVRWLYNNAPNEAHGSSDVVDKWQARGGLLAKNIKPIHQGTEEKRIYS